jgi:4-amino-4-deoxy-L-arabinose transferase-like glycosyltransferase
VDYVELYRALRGFLKMALDHQHHRWTRYLPVGLWLIFLLLNLLSIINKTPTYDEGTHYRYGAQILQLDARRFDESKMPFSAINLLPCSIGRSALRIFGSGSALDALCHYQTARAMTMLYALLIAVYVFRWSRELYGETAGHLALALYAFSPNIIAHSRLITTDIYATGMMLVATYHFRQFLNAASWRNAAVSALTLGLAQLAKYSCIFLYPIFGLLLVGRFAAPLYLNFRAGNAELLREKLKPIVGYTLLFLVINLLVLNLGFLGHRTLIPLAGYEFRSSLFQEIQSAVGPLARIPLPLPYPFLQGLDWTRFDDTHGETFGQIYLLGRLAERGSGFPGYYFIAWLYKVPLPIQILVYVAIGHYLWRRRDFCFSRDEVFLLLPVLFLVVYLNFFLSAQLGIRYLLPVLPFLFIFTGSLVRNWKDLLPRSQVLVSLMLGWLAISNLSYFPHYLSYFNELVWNRKQAYEILADSNLDWGQNRLYLAQHCQLNPACKINPDGPTTGMIIVGANDLLGITSPPERYRWLREHFRPSGHVAYSYLVFEIRSEDLNRNR